MELVDMLSLLSTWLLVKNFFAFKLEVAFADHWRVLGLKVPNLPSNLSSNSNPVAAGVKSKAVDR